jgi:hypothetical protein
VKKSKFSSKHKRNDNEIDNELLLEAVDSLGVYTPIEAAQVWGTGLKSRNAALQYSVMNDELKKKYKIELEKNAPNWVTGVSSPWVDSYSILSVENIALNEYIVEVLFFFSTPEGHYGSAKALLNISRYGNFCKIDKIAMEDFLYPYTGFSKT